MHRFRLQLHFLAFAHQVVSTVAANLTGGILRGHLLDLADEIGKHALYQLACDVRRGIGRIDLMFHIVAGCRSAQLQGGRILFVVQLQTLYLLRLLASTQYQHTCGQRVEGPRMSYLHPSDTHTSRHTGPHKGQRAEGRHPIGLVDVYVFSLYEVHLIDHC